VPTVPAAHPASLGLLRRERPGRGAVLLPPMLRSHGGQAGVRAWRPLATLCAAVGVRATVRLQPLRAHTRTQHLCIGRAPSQLPRPPVHAPSWRFKRLHRMVSPPPQSDFRTTPPHPPPCSPPHSPVSLPPPPPPRTQYPRPHHMTSALGPSLALAHLTPTALCTLPLDPLPVQLCPCGAAQRCRPRHGGVRVQQVSRCIPWHPGGVPTWYAQSLIGMVASAFALISAYI
jgi:hypothetical protein